MRRPLAVLSLLTVGWLAVPAVPAFACTVPAPSFQAGSDSVRRGGSLHVSGEGTTGGCSPVHGAPTTAPPSTMPTETPSETPAPSTEAPSETPPPTTTTPAPTTAAPSETPAPTTEAPTETPPTTTTPPAFPLGPLALRPAAAVVAVPDTEVVFSLAREGSAVGQPIDTLPEHHTAGGVSFDGTITVPASVAPGSYVLSARGTVSYGSRPLVVRGALPDTGAGHTASLLKVALMFGLTGVAALAGGVLTARRVSGS